MFDYIFPNDPLLSKPETLKQIMFCITSLIFIFKQIYIKQRDPSLSLGGIDLRLEVVVMLPL